jgi:hypothetical protein
MLTRDGRLVLLALFVLTPGVTPALDTGFDPPTAFYVDEPFGREASPFNPASWESIGGNWQPSGGTYDSTVASPSAVTTLFEYFIDPFGGPSDAPRANFTLRARILNQGGTATQLAGVIYNYFDADSYDEAVFSPTGTLLLRHVNNGTVTTFLTTSYSGGARNVWFDVNLTVNSRMLTLAVNGITRVNALMLADVRQGRIGFVTHNTTAKFDDLQVGSPFLQQPFSDNFSNGLQQPPWTVSSPAWTVADGTLNNSAVEQTSRAGTSGRTSFGPESTVHYRLYTRMFNPYGGSGNLVGFFFNDNGDFAPPDSRGELVFSPTGIARIDLFYDGARHTIATAPYKGGGARKWFDVRLDADLSSVSVWVNGELVFGNVDTSPVQEGSVGLVTHWAPGRFDDVSWDNNAHPLLIEKFDEPLAAPNWVTSGTWTSSGGSLSSSAIGREDLAIYQCRCWNTNAVIRARLLNQYGASGNLVGLVYNYVDAGAAPDAADYNEVVFSSTGLAHLNTVINGVRTRIASSTHTVPRNTWFNVEVLRRGTTTTVKVNGATIFDRVAQAQLGTGKVGVVTHWSKGRFDDVIVRDDPPR